MPCSKRSLSQFPLLEDTWLIGTSRLQTWVKEGDSLPRRSYLILIASSNTGLLCGSNLVPEIPVECRPPGIEPTNLSPDREFSFEESFQYPFHLIICNNNVSKGNEHKGTWKDLDFMSIGVSYVK